MWRSGWWRGCAALASRRRVVGGGGSVATRQVHRNVKRRREGLGEAVTEEQQELAVAAGTLVDLKPSVARVKQGRRLLEQDAKLEKKKETLTEAKRVNKALVACGDDVGLLLAAFDKEEASEAASSSLSAVNLATLIHRLGVNYKEALNKHAKRVKGVLERARVHALAEPLTWGEQAVANAVLGTQRLRGPPEVLEALAGAAAPRLNDWEPHHLATAAAALAARAVEVPQLREALLRPFFQALAEAAQAKAKTTDENEPTAAGGHDDGPLLPPPPVRVRFDLVHMSRIAWALAQVGCEAPNALRALAKAAEARCHRAEPSDIATMAWALSKTGVPAPKFYKAAAKALCDKGERALADRVGGLDAQGLADLAWAFAHEARAPSSSSNNNNNNNNSKKKKNNNNASLRSQAEDDDDDEGRNKRGDEFAALYAALARAIPARLRQMTPQALCSVAGAFTATERRAARHRAVVEAVAWTLAPAARQRQKVDSIAKNFPESLRGLAVALAKAKVSAQPVFAAVADAVCQSDLLLEDPVQLCDLAWAFSRSARPDPGENMNNNNNNKNKDDGEDQTAAALMMIPEATSRVLDAASAAVADRRVSLLLRPPAAALMGRLLEEEQEEEADGQRVLRPRDVIRLAEAVSTCGVGSMEFYDAVARALEPHAATLSPREVTLTLTALAHARLVAPTLVAALAAAAAERAAALRFGDIAACAWALAELRVEAPRFYRAAQTAALAKLATSTLLARRRSTTTEGGSVSITAVSRLAWALCVAEQYDALLALDEALAEALDLCLTARPRPEDAARLLAALVALRDEDQDGKQQQKGGTLKGGALACVLSRVEPTLHTVASLLDAPTMPSPALDEAADALRRLDWRHDRDVLDGDARLDFADPKHKRCVLFLSPADCVASLASDVGTSLVTAQTELKCRHLRHRGWTVLPVPEPEWVALFDDDAQDDYLHEKTTDAGFWIRDDDDDDGSSGDEDRPQFLHVDGDDADQVSDLATRLSRR